MRRLLTAGVVAGVTFALSIVSAPIGPAGAAVTPEVKAFCKAVSLADNAVESAWEDPTPRQQRAVDRALTGIEETAPPGARDRRGVGRRNPPRQPAERRRPVREPGAR